MDAANQKYLQRAIELAGQAGAAGEFPFASLLVLDGAIVAEMQHSGRSDHDLTAHPELKLARWAAREAGRKRTAQATMYTLRTLPDVRGGDPLRRHRSRGIRAEPAAAAGDQPADATERSAL